jgi:hypothetical protein
VVRQLQDMRGYGMRRPLLLLALIPALAPVLDAQSRAQYAGGTSSQLSAGVDGRIEVSDEDYFAFYSKKTQVRVPYDRINLVEYGQTVSRRVAMAIAVSIALPGVGPLLLLSKSRKHFLTVGYTGDDGKQQALVFRVDKGGIRVTLVSLEARTGLKVEYQDEEARKAGKG